MSDTRSPASPHGRAAPGDLDLLIVLLKLGSFINTPMKDSVCDPCGISQIELKVIMALAGEGALAGHDMVEIMGMPAMNVSRAIAGLRARGWVEDASDAGNRRRRPVRLSAQGQAGYEAMKPQLLAVADALVGGLGGGDRRAFTAAADRIIAAMASWITGHHADVRLAG